MKKVKHSLQWELFSPSYAESGNTHQLSPVTDDESVAGKCSTDDCSTLLPAAGNRNTNGSMNNVGSNGYYWSSTPNGSNGYNLNFNSGNINVNNNNNRNNGFPVRCVQAFTQETVPSFSVFTLNKEQLLLDLFQAYYDARKHKRNTINQLRFEINLEENMVMLRDELMDRLYKVGNSTCFIIEDPVKREIFAADFRDRVVHHLLYNYINPIFERTFIADSYSCRKGKGTLYGIKRLEHHIRSCSKNYAYPCYILKLDIQGYFMSINRKILLDMCEEELQKYALRKTMEGKRWNETIDYAFVRYLLKEIIDNDSTENCIVKGDLKDWDGLPFSKSLFNTAVDCGLPIGNLTSQLFSNIYLNKLDRYVTQVLNERHYGRYVDDFFIVSHNRAKLKRYIAILRTFIKDELGLTLHPKKQELIRTDYGIVYLGVMVKHYRRYIANKTKKRIIAKINLLKQCENATFLQNSINSYIGYLKHCKSGRLKQQLFGGEEWQKFGIFESYYNRFICKNLKLRL